MIAGLRRTSLTRMVEPVLDMVVLFHVHDNLGARWRRVDQRPELDPLRLDLHLPPGRGTIDWSEVAPSLLAHDAPCSGDPPRAAAARGASSAGQPGRSSPTPPTCA